MIVNVLPFKVAGPLIKLNATGSPELEVAERLMGAVPYTTPGNAAKETVCGAFETTKL
jgi:hypothetical protein